MPSSLSELSLISRLAERDIDFILLEELEVSDSFRAWFSARVYGIPVFKVHVGAWHSVSHSGLGESDLVFLFEANDGSRKSVLIENKIDALPQPNQGQRYQHRGEQGKKDDDWDEFRTCIIAPRGYLNSANHAEIYDAEISYEEIMAYFVSRGFRDPRFTYRADLMRQGIEQKPRNYVRKISREMTTFVQEYVDYVSKAFPNLGVEAAKERAPGSTWVGFDPEGKSKDTQIVHQTAAGFVKIFLSGRADQLDEYIEKYKDQPVPEFEVLSTGKSVVLALPVAKIDPIKEGFLASRDRVIESLSKLDQLITLARSHGDLD